MKNAGEMKHITCLFDHAENCGDALQDEGYAGDRHAVAQRFIPCAVGCIRDIRPAIGEALEPLTFQRSQAADEVGMLYDAFVLADELIVDAFVIGIADGSHRLLIGWLTDEVGGILVLPSALRAGNIIGFECIHALASIDRMPI